MPVWLEGIGKGNVARPQGPANNAIKQGGGTEKPGEGQKSFQLRDAAVGRGKASYANTRRPE